MPISKLASKINVSKLIFKSSQSYLELYKDSSFKSTYPSVTKIVSLLSEGMFSSWNEKLILDSFINQILFLEKRQPNRSLKQDDLEFLRKIAEAAPKEELLKRGSIGSSVHNMINSLIFGKEVKETPLIQNYLASYRMWQKVYPIQLYYTDIFVKSEKYKYSGFADAVGMTETGDLVLIDFKTGNSVYNTHAIQLAAYCKAFEECYDCTEPIQQAYILQLKGDNADFQFFKVDDIDQCFSSFLHLRELYNLQINNQNLFHPLSSLIVCSIYYFFYNELLTI